MREKEILSAWPIHFSSIGKKELITGSPNRTEERFLFRDEEGIYYIAEGYSESKKAFQIRQNLLLEFLAENHLWGIHPFYRTLSGEHGAEKDHLFWQVRPYIPAGGLPRNSLGKRKNLGIFYGEFLLQMKELIADAPAPPPMPNAPFYIANFLPKLENLAERKMPSIMGELRHFEEKLIPFLKWERKADGFFAHGDFHPGNILADDKGIRAVIDWEFAGIKFPGYDMALLIGCLGMDDPNNLSGETVKALQDTLYLNDFMEDEAWDLLPQQIAATRMGWLGEWLNLGENSLVEQELTLLSILLDE